MEGKRPTHAVERSVDHHRLGARGMDLLRRLKGDTQGAWKTDALFLHAVKEDG